MKTGNDHCAGASFLDYITAERRCAMQVVCVGIDNTREPGYALRWAVDLIDSISTPARLHPIHVVKPAPAGFLGLPSHVPPSIMREQHQIARQELDALVREVRDQTSIDADARIAEVEPAEVLIEVAHDTDLLVLGAGSHGRANRLIMGSTTQRCVTAGVVPLAIIPRLDPGLSSHPIPRVVRCEAS